MKRPLSVWTTLVLLLMSCLIFIPAFIAWINRRFDSLVGSTKPAVDVFLFYTEFLVILLILGFLVLSIVAIWTRWPRARIIGLAALLLIFSAVFYSKRNALPAGDGLPKFQMNSAAERGGAFIADTLMFIGFWILWFRFGFSKKSRLFFGQPKSAIQESVKTRATDGGS